MAETIEAKSKGENPDFHASKIWQCVVVGLTRQMLCQLVWTISYSFNFNLIGAYLNISL